MSAINFWPGVDLAGFLGVGLAIFFFIYCILASDKSIYPLPMQLSSMGLVIEALKEGIKR